MDIRKICVLGLGYIGLPTASTLAAHGVEVLGVDVNPRILEILQSGEIHIHEGGLREAYRAARELGQICGSRPARRGGRLPDRRSHALP